VCRVAVDDSRSDAPGRGIRNSREAEWNAVNSSINGAQRRRHNARHRTASAATTHLSFLQENVMSDPTRLYEPLTSENAALILIDHQVGLMTGFAITRREN